MNIIFEMDFTKYQKLLFSNILIEKEVFISCASKFEQDLEKSLKMKWEELITHNDALPCPLKKVIEFLLNPNESEKQDSLLKDL